MSLEARVEQLESHFDSLDSAVRSLVKITGETHQEILATRQEMREYQQENRLRFAHHDREISGVKADVSALAEAMLAGFKKSDEQHNEFVKETRERFDQQDRRFDQQDRRFDQLELLIRQSLPKN
ncbi:hypothetical protein [Sansalvadorimonas verongulae]|uniref:hypothetical protein n=1 Tax=Sansalvadorimonas verongulae TaxID=2172824 RepID=UPI0012BBD33E|nr:hypothetical protein [Sansalvadorimonas verongulae]MTI14615.1 hypothetical protein [Sansalvadorimonas verongulae]